ncbi:hypothetical protein EC99P1_00084 [Enterococcus phage EC99P1]|nr:hypothetical protein EC99P1_00084 [Enterococcus phage EC99P1]
MEPQDNLQQAFDAYQATVLPPDVDAIDISELKLMLGYFNTSIRDNLLKVLKKRARQHICQVIKQPVLQFPLELDYIADELTAARLSSLNSEGLKTESTDITRYDYKDDIYANWMPILLDWADDNDLLKGRKFKMK